MRSAPEKTTTTPAGFWGYIATAPAPEAPTGLPINSAEWQSLSPGMRREITRTFGDKP